MPSIRLCTVQEVPMHEAKVFSLKNRKIALFHRPTGFFALDDHCPHRSGPLSEGLIDNEEVVCPWHQWSFRFQDGSCANIPGMQVATFPVHVQNSEVWIDL